VGEVGKLLVRALEGRIVDQDVQPPKLGHCTPNELLAMALLADVSFHEHGLAAGFPDPVSGLFRGIATGDDGDTSRAQPMSCRIT
jgi:hypothetical protein